MKNGIKKSIIALLLPLAVIGSINAQQVRNGQPMAKPMMMMNEQPVPKPLLGMDMSQSMPEKALFKAIKKGETKTISDLIKDKKVNVNTAMPRKGTPLMFAAKMAALNPDMDGKMARVVKVLLKNDANPSLTGPRGMTALMIAAKGGADKTIKALLPNSTIREQTINMDDLQGKNALNYASQAGNEATVKLLLSYKEIRPTPMAAMQAKVKNIKKMIQGKMDKLIKAGKMQMGRM